MARLSCAVLLLGARAASATTATDTFTATLPTATETFTLPTTAATSTETYTLPTATFTLPTGGETATHTFTLPTSTATYNNETSAPTKSPTSPTGSPSASPAMSPSQSPSGTEAPSASPTGEGDTITPTSRPSKVGDTSVPITPTASPSKQGDTGTPRAPTDSPSKLGDTNVPTKSTSAPTPTPPTGSPTHPGDTITPTTQEPTSTVNHAQLHSNIAAIYNQTLTIAYGGPGCTGTSGGGSVDLKVENAIQTVVAGGVQYVFKLDSFIETAQADDKQDNTGSCSTGGFVFNFRKILAAAIVLSPPERMPLNDISFSQTAGTSHRRNQVLGKKSDGNVRICDGTMDGTCVTLAPTNSPTVSPSRGRGGGDDDFPGWAIALCVVLPVLAIGAAVAIYFFVCNKGDGDATEPNAPDSTGDDTKKQDAQC